MRKSTLLTITLLMLFSTVLFGQIPKTLSYQGLLSNGDGSALNDGDYSIKFSLYAQESGGTALWEELQTVSVSNGIFSAVLGNSTSLDLPFDEPYWLGIMVENDTEMSPRTALTSSAYSLSDSGGTTNWNKTGNILSYSEGNIGIGTTTPENKLEVSSGSIRISNSGESNILLHRPFLYLNHVGAPNEGIPDFGGGIMWQKDSVSKMEMFYYNDGNELIFWDDNLGPVALLRDTGSLWLNRMIEPSGIMFRDGSQLTSANDGIGGKWNGNGDDIFYNNGNVGLGTTEPMEFLQIGDYNSLSNNYLKIATAGVFAEPIQNRWAGIKLRHYNNNWGVTIESLDGQENAGLFIRTHDNDSTGQVAMSINRGGNVGIGTETPIAKLQVIGGIHSESNDGLFRTHPFFGESDGTTLLGTFHGNDLGAQLRFDGARDGFMDIGEDSLGNFVVESNDEIILSVATNGHVGVGTNTPEWPLEIKNGSPYGTWSAITNTSTGGRQWALISTGELNDESAGSLLVRDNSANEVRMTLDENGNVGIGTYSPVHPLEMASGAHVTAGGVWTNASSRSLKENISALTTKEAFDALSVLNPVKYNYLSEKSENYVGFIAEDVPDVVAMNDRKSLSSMDIVALLTKVVKEQQKSIELLSNELELLKKKVELE